MWKTSLRIAAILCVAAPFAAGADDFSFKRVKVGDAQPGKRITVQIDPEEQARFLAALPKVDPDPDHGLEEPKVAENGVDLVPGPAPASSYGWYWDVGAPRLQHMQEVSEKYGKDILRATLDTNVSPALVLAVIGIESAGKSDAVSHAGAVGLMQLIPATAERFGVKDSTDPVQNIEGGVAYLDWLLKKFDYDPVLALAAYNAGEGAVIANEGVPPYAETRDYVPKVLAAWQVAQGLCVSPPLLVTDPCIFRTDIAGL